MTLYYEDFEIGQKFESKERIVSPTDINRFAEVTGDLNRLHLDEEYAKTTIFKRTIAHGMLTLSLSLGLWYSLNLTRESIVAFVGFNEVRFKSPVYAGDSVHLVSEVRSKRESQSRPETGLVTLKDEIINSNNKVALESERVLLIRKKGRTV